MSKSKPHLVLELCGFRIPKKSSKSGKSVKPQNFSHLLRTDQVKKKSDAVTAETQSKQRSPEDNVCGVAAQIIAAGKKVRGESDQDPTMAKSHTCVGSVSSVAARIIAAGKKAQGET